MDTFAVRDILILLGACAAGAIWLIVREFGKNAQDSAQTQSEESTEETGK